MRERPGSALLEILLALALLVMLMPVIFNFVLVYPRFHLDDGVILTAFRDRLLRQNSIDDVDHEYIGDQIVRYGTSTGSVRQLVPRVGSTSQCNLRPHIQPDQLVPLQIMTGFGGNNILTDIHILSDERLFISFDGNQSPNMDIYSRVWNASANSYFPGSAINTGPGIRRLAIDERNQLVFAASTGSQYQLQLISFVNETGAFDFVRNIQVSSTTGATGQSVALDAERNLLAFGLSKNDGPELYVFDIASRTDPIVRDMREVGTQINDLAFRDGWLYMATPERPQVHRMKIGSDEMIGAYQSATFTGDLVQDASRLIFVGESLWVIRTVGGFNVKANPEIVRLDISDPNGLLILEQYDIGASVNGFAYFDSVFMTAIGESIRKFVVSIGSQKQEFNSGILPLALACSEEQVLVGYDRLYGTVHEPQINFYSFVHPYVP